MTNTELFSGKAKAYALARPSYPPAAIDYILSLLPQNAVVADIGAGTGKFTELPAQRGLRVFAVEPNADMRGELTHTLSPYKNAEIVCGTAETTTLPDNCADAVTCAQALHWFDPEMFRAECKRIAKNNAPIIAIYNVTPSGSSPCHSKDSTEKFFASPTVRDFANPITFTREKWLIYMTSHSHNPAPSDANYAAHVAEMNAVFDRDAVDGALTREIVTRVYWEVL